MEGLYAFIWPIAIGIAYFALITLLNKFKRFSYKSGFFLALILILIFLGVVWVVASQDPSAWVGLGLIIMAMVSGMALAAYLLSWLVVSLVTRKA